MFKPKFVFAFFLFAISVSKSYANCELITLDLNMASHADLKDLDLIAQKYSHKGLSYGVSPSKDESKSSIESARRMSELRAMGNLRKMMNSSVVRGVRVIDDCVIKTDKGVVYSIKGVSVPVN